MNQTHTITKFSPAQTAQAEEIQKVALWVAGRIGPGMLPEDMILLRDTLLSLAVQVESVELLLTETLSSAREIALDALGQTGGAA